jgi:hypothetical protein
MPEILLLKLLFIGTGSLTMRSWFMKVYSPNSLASTWPLIASPIAATGMPRNALTSSGGSGLGAGLITGFVLEEFVVEDTDTVTREYNHDLAVTLALGDHG